MNTDNIREAFEAEFSDAMRRKNHPWWQCVSDVAFRKNKLSGEYILDLIQMGFIGYQAAHAASEKRISELEASYKMRGKAHSPVISALQADNKRLAESQINVAISYIRSQVEAFDRENGCLDPDTNSFEFSNEHAESWSNGIHELIEELEALSPTESLEDK